MTPNNAGNVPTPLYGIAVNRLRYTPGNTIFICGQTTPTMMCYGKQSFWETYALINLQAVCRHHCSLQVVLHQQMYAIAAWVRWEVLKVAAMTHVHRTAGLNTADARNERTVLQYTEGMHCAYTLTCALWTVANINMVSPVNIWYQVVNRSMKNWWALSESPYRLSM